MKGMNWELLRPAKQAQLQHLTGKRLSEVTPSIRNFAQYVTNGLFPILESRTPELYEPLT